MLWARVESIAWPCKHPLGAAECAADTRAEGWTHSVPGERLEGISPPGLGARGLRTKSRAVAAAT